MQLNNYSRKYFLEWTDDKGVPHRLDVFQKGYGGIASEVTGAKDPVKVVQRVDEEFGTAFVTTNMSMTFLTDEAIGQTFTDLAAPSEREFYVEYLRTDSGDSVLYRCFVTPAEIQEFMKPSSNLFVFTASDMLSNIDHVVLSERFTPYQTVSLIELMDWALDVYGLNFHLNDKSGWNCTSPSFSNSVLEKLDIHTEAFFESGEAMNLSETIDTMLRALDCVVVQAFGELHVMHVFGWGSKSTTWLNFRKEYTSYPDGTGTWTKTEPTRHMISAPLELQPLNNDMFNRTLPPYKSITRSYKSPLRNILFNPSFEIDDVGAVPTGDITNWELTRITNSTGTVDFEITEDQAKSDGNKSLGCIGVQSRQAMQVRADMDAGTKLSLLTSQEVSEGDWGVKTLAEIGGTGITSANLRVNFLAEMDETNLDQLDYIRYHVVVRVVYLGFTYYYDMETQRWGVYNSLAGSKGQMCYMASSTANNWETMEIPILFYQESSQIFIDIYAPEFLGKEESGSRPDMDDINLYIDDVSLTASPVESGTGAVSASTGYFNISFVADDFNVSGAFKQEFLFMTTDAVPLMAKCLRGQVLENNFFNLPTFSWYYEDSVSKSSESLEVQSTYHLNQGLSLNTNRYTFSAFNLSSSSLSMLSTLKMELTRKEEPLLSAIGTLEIDGGTGVVSIEGYTCQSITSVEDPTDPTEPVVTEVTADYKSSATVIADPCGATYDDTDTFTLYGGGFKSNELLYAEDTNIQVPPDDGDYVYLKVGTFWREFTYNSVGQKYYPTGSTAVKCN